MNSTYEPIRISVEVLITPSGTYRQNKITVIAGETVLDAFEEDVPPEALLLIKRIAAAHGRMLVKWGQ